MKKQQHMVILEEMPEENGAFSWEKTDKADIFNK